MPNDLVKISDYGLKNINYYWVNKEKFNISDLELQGLGIEGNFAYINQNVIPALIDADKDLSKHGFNIIVKDAYRSPEQYKLVQQKRYEIDGKENTDRTLNTTTMPHATGYTLDINLYDSVTGIEMDLWNKNDWPDGIFVNFYKDKTDEKSRQYQTLQDLMISIMLKHGFKLGSKNEIWHFEYR